jgi:hypothetical protein
MRRPTELLPRRASRRLAPLRWLPAMLLLAAMVLGTGGQALRPLGRPWAGPGVALRF